MTRRQRIEDLTTFALPGQPTLSPDGTRGRLRPDNRGRRRRRRTALPLARDGPRPPGRAGSGPAATDTGEGGLRAGLVARRDQDRVPAGGRRGGAGVAAPRRRRGTRAGHHAAAAGRRARWSPDGTKIAFGAPVDLRAVPGEDDAARARRAAAPVVTTRLDYKADGAGLLGTVRTHLHVLDLAGGTVSQVTEGDWHAGDPVWSPDSTRLAFGAATAPDADLRSARPRLPHRRVRPVRASRNSSPWPTASAPRRRGRRTDPR